MKTIKNDLVTTKQAADLIGCCEKSVYNYIKSGLLKPVRIGGTKKAGKTRINIREIERFLRG